MSLLAVIPSSLTSGLSPWYFFKGSLVRPLYAANFCLLNSRKRNEEVAWQRFMSSSRARRKALHNTLKDRSEQFWKTEQKLRTRSRILLNNLEQKYKIKEKMERIIERENIWTFPNILCLMRICASPYLGYLIVKEDFNIAFYLMMFAGFTDLLDGLIARNYRSQASKLGSFLDPLADKILISTMFITMTYVDLVPVALTSLIIARDVWLAAIGFYIRYLSLPPPKTFARYFDLSHATAKIKPLFISKVNTLFQLATAGISLTSPVFGFSDHPYLLYLWSVTASTTIISAICYVYFSKDTYKILRKAGSS
ncbi:probable cardiolipin synthase (CMP-forming) [Cimex lectularius]|uniref:cardiolipin synthase (CMP-forming) n=1 Tax=Cimex lectularius TaxID=79782 RepID=A0A8I6TDV4_CIMLE|nr:probable cardiolipin synthase (CMP-forming) [Cimex lectularius]